MSRFGRRQFIISVTKVAMGALILPAVLTESLASDELVTVRTVAFPEGLSHDERVQRLDEIIEAGKMRRIIQQHKKSGALVKTECLSRRNEMVFKYYFSSIEDKLAFERQIKDVKVISEDIKILA